MMIAITRSFLRSPCKYRKTRFAAPTCFEFGYWDKSMIEKLRISRNWGNRGNPLLDLDIILSLHPRKKPMDCLFSSWFLFQKHYPGHSGIVINEGHIIPSIGYRENRGNPTQITLYDIEFIRRSTLLCVAQCVCLNWTFDWTFDTTSLLRSMRRWHIRLRTASV